MAFQKFCRLIFLIFPIERDPESSLAFLTAVIDADIFDADPLCGKDRGENGDGSRLVENIHTEGVIPLDRSLATVWKG